VENAATGTGAQVTDGAKVSKVDNGSAAQSAGLESGDVITKVDEPPDHLLDGAGGDDPVLPPRRRGHRHLRARRQHPHLQATLDSDAETTNS
jgi:C-terminal processing protease CtpA/Prc